jgi:glucoamylase
MDEDQGFAPGRPGIEPRWTSSAKNGVGTAINRTSRVWFTLSHGIFNEIYYPRLDQACVRDMGMIVTVGREFFSEEKRDCASQLSYAADGVPAFHLKNTCKQGRYRIDKEVISDPRRDVVLQKTHFTPLMGKMEDYHLHVLLAPHLGNHGAGNTAWVGDYKGTSMLFAERDSTALALACSLPWLHRSAGFSGVSDGWQDLVKNYKMTWFYSRAEDGNVALTGEIDLAGSDGRFILSLGFGRNPAEAGFRALASLQDGYDPAHQTYVQGWQNWQKHIFPMDNPDVGGRDLYYTSAAVMRSHEASRFPGGLIASLSIPWGYAKGDDDLGGYHLVWPRDLAEAAGGLLAAGQVGDVLRVLHYLQATQESEGYWPQNMWLDGTPYWDGIQMDETAFPILVMDLARREGALNADEKSRLWPMVRRAAGFLVRNGPVTPEDRWEEDPGYSPFTLAVEISALLAAADMAELNGEAEAAEYLRETADAWNDQIERWVYITGSDLAKDEGVEGYYVRIAPPEVAEGASLANGFVPIKNRPPGQSREPAANIVSPDALALVRFGLRAADDERILNTITIIDRLLKVETPCGPAWHRYNDDGYGEHEDGSPFDGSGIGRAWPLLTGERAHYELAAGRREVAVQLLHVLAEFANDGGLIPEQVWDAPDIPKSELFFGRPSGSAMPLVWAHAEYIKLRRSLHEGRVFDMPPQPYKRYVREKTGSAISVWRPNQKYQHIPKGRILRVEVFSPALVRWSGDGWASQQDTKAVPTGFGTFKVDLPTKDMAAGSRIDFTFHWQEEDRWEEGNYTVTIEA